MLGINDKFNLCSRSTDNVKMLCKTILDFEFKNSLACNVPESREMSRGILESIRPYTPLIRWDAFYKYLLNIIELDSSQVVLGTASKLVYLMMLITLQYLMRVYVFSLLFNYLLVRAINSAHRKRNVIAKDLSERYSLHLAEAVGSPIRSTLFTPAESFRSACPRGV